VVSPESKITRRPRPRYALHLRPIAAPCGRGRSMATQADPGRGRAAAERLAARDRVRGAGGHDLAQVVAPLRHREPLPDDPAPGTGEQARGYEASGSPRRGPASSVPTDISFVGCCGSGTSSSGASTTPFAPAAAAGVAPCSCRVSPGSARPACCVPSPRRSQRRRPSSVEVATTCTPRALWARSRTCSTGRAAGSTGGRTASVTSSCCARR
jgi:hypothetical protein